MPSNPAIPLLRELFPAEKPHEAIALPVHELEWLARVVAFRENEICFNPIANMLPASRVKSTAIRDGSFVGYALREFLRVALEVIHVVLRKS